MDSLVNRRDFLKSAGPIAALGMAHGGTASVSLVVEPADAVATAAPAQWAAKELEQSLHSRGIPVHRCEHLAQAAAGSFRIVAGGIGAPLARSVLREAGVSVAAVPEALGLVPAKAPGAPLLLACGHDARGLTYALLELADRAQHAPDPLAALAISSAVVEQPANRVRSVARLFTSDVEDKPWYNDREMWPRYFAMLAANRFNRFQLSLGIGYDFLRNVTDGYFLFSYPFLLGVPGYDVRAPQLPPAERDQNLETLRFISEQAVARGVDFQLGLWMHGCKWLESPHPNYTIEGLTRETHGPYCRDALSALLKACPAISGVTFRVHGESGVEEGSYEFWKTVFDGVVKSGRKVGIDMHAKGMDQTMIDLALATGAPVTISPKYWGEHLGMPYHQADIRELERPRPGQQATGLMKLSSGSRSFLRYGYGDLLREDRRWGVLHRIWPGTQRLLIWGDPLTAAAHSRAFSFCGSDGVEIFEPLSFKGRRGSGVAGGRCAYADAALKPRWDWEKYVYSHRIWGRLLYNPGAEPDVWRRLLRAQIGPAAPATEAALAHSSRILPVVTTAHAPSAGNNTYWPEIYLNQSLVDPDHPGPYRDSPAPRVFGNVSPLDPQLFSRINDYADELLAGESGAKYSPVDAAQWIEDYAAAAAKYLAQAESAAVEKERPEWRRLSIDIAIQCGLGRFFGAKFRSGVLYRIYERTGDRTALEHAVGMYRAARAVWAGLAEKARGVYLPDITVGEQPQLRGHWLDRLPAMDQDIAALAAKLDQVKDGARESRVAHAIQVALGRPNRAAVRCIHTPPTPFRPGRPIDLELTAGAEPASVRLYYRRVNHAERFESSTMEVRDGRYHAVIPAAYTETPYPIQYYFELRLAPESAMLYPGLGADPTAQPYFVVRRA